MLCIPYEEMKEGAEGEGVIPCDPQYCIHTIILNENSAGIIIVQCWNKNIMALECLESNPLENKYRMTKHVYN